MKGILVLTLCFCIFSGCTPRRREKSSDVPFGRYTFAYSIENQAALGLIQVFDDGQKTYLKFLPDKPPGLKVRTEGKKLLEMQEEGGFFTVDGTHERLTIKGNSKEEATIRRFHEISPKPLYVPERRDDTL